MTEEKFDFRRSSITTALQGVEEPQPEYCRLAQERLKRLDGAVNIFRYEDVVRINRDQTVLGQGGAGVTLGSARPFIPNDIDGPDHVKWRKLLDPMFSPKAMKPLEDSIVQLAQELIDKFIDDGEVELFSAYCVPLPAIIFLRLLGAPLEDLPFFLEFKDGALHPQGDTAEELAANAAKAGAKMVAYFENLVEKRRATPLDGDDLITALLRAEVDGRPVTDEEFIDILYVLMLAGIDTTSSMLSLIFSWLARHPETLQRLIEDPSLTDDAIEDIMRFETPVPAVNRFATVDIDLGDGEIVKAGEAMHVMLATANVDPEQFPDPLSVDIERKRHTHLVFASGIHRCLGSHLARLELRAGVKELHRRVSSYAMKDGESAQYNNVVIRAAFHLPIVFDKK